MDNDSPSPDQFMPQCMTITHGSALDASAFFPRSRNFTVSGGTFTSVTNNYNEPTLPPDFRRIPFGDINLKHNIRLRSPSGLVDCYRARGSVRRMHSARIHGDNSDMTVAMYKGDGAEEEWRDTISKYSHLRHPNVLQIFAIASSAGTHAIVAHDDLMPSKEFLKLIRDSPILSVYIYGCWDSDRREVNEYFAQEFGNYRGVNNSISWIRRSTGRLCMDLVPTDVAAPNFHLPGWTTSFDHIPSLDDPNSEAIMIDSLQLGEYHDVCYWHLRKCQTFPVSPQAELHLGAVVYSPCSSELDDSLEIAFLPDANMFITSWNCVGADGHIMDDGWTRYKSSKIFGATINSSIYLEYGDQMAWLSQANHIFHRLQIKANYEDYVVFIWWIDLRLQIVERTQTPPNSYLFVCPLEDLRTEAGSYRWPDSPAYWSLDPSGVERLSTDEATYLGFPSFELETTIDTRFWDASVYAGLRKFHTGKGFDPDSQDIAQHLGQPLFKLSHEMEVPSAHVDEISDAERESEGSAAADCLEEHECVLDVDSQRISESVPQSWTWKAMMFVQLGLILALSFGSLYEYRRAVLSQTQ